MLQRKSQQNQILFTLCGAIAFTLVLAGCGGGDDKGTPPANSARSKQENIGADAEGGGASGPSAAPAAAPTGMASGGGGMPGGMMSGGMGGGAGGQQAAAATQKPKNIAPAPGFRSDPLRPWWDTTPKPPPVLTYVDPVRIAIVNSAAEEKPEGVEIQEVPSRRVAGILTGNGVYALIDDFAGGAEVVKPGQVLNDGYRVVSINANSVVLKKVVDNRTYTQVVPLTDAGATSRFSGAPQGGMGMPGVQPGASSGGKRGGRSVGGAGGMEN